MTLHLADKLKLPTAIATQAIAVLGIRGSGKTNTAGVIAEELLAIGQPVVVVDPTDAWWGLRSSSDGKSAGFPILICGGSHGDLPLAENDGKALAEFLVAEQVSAILSVRHLRKEAQRRFFVALAEELYHLKGRPENRSALTLVIDEASTFVPQDVRGQTATSAGAVEDIVNRGRNVGFGVVMINQRAATLNKNVLTQCDTLVIHRMPSPQDRKAIRDWIDENASDEQAAAVMESMAKLGTGEAWFWSPALELCQRVRVRLKRTFDSSRTPKIGEAPRQPKRLAEVDLEQLKGKMASSVEQAKANDPKLLKARIAELEKALNTKGTKDAKGADQATVDRAVAAAVKQTEAQTLGYSRELERKLKQLGLVLRKIADLAAAQDVEATTLPVRPAATNILPAATNKPVVSPDFRPPRTDRPAAADNGGLSKAERAILAAFYWLKDEEATPAKVAFYSDYSAGSSTSNNALGRLRHGLVSGWKITADGIAAAEALGVGEKPAGGELLGWLKGRLGRAECALLDALVAAYPNRLSAAEIGERSGYSVGSSTFNNAIGKLRTIEAAEGYERDGGAKAADVFFQ
jgi:hypothetical protein